MDAQVEIVPIACKECGCELGQADAVCPECGASIIEDTAEGCGVCSTCVNC